MAAKANQKLLEDLVKKNIDQDAQDWLHEKILKIVGEKSAREIYLTYSLLARKVEDRKLNDFGSSELELYLKLQEATVLEICRLYLLTEILIADPDFFAPKVKKIIAVTDSSELETFLKYLILLPHPEDYKTVAVDALRTNIATVFDAISLHNPYPAEYFDDKQWNQMYLKAAFMQRPLDKIANIDKRTNKDLARIISDYAHERWAAGRDIDPYFWRPVAQFMDERLLGDMQHLLESKDPTKNKVAALCCASSDFAQAKKLLEEHPKLHELIKNNQLSWDTSHNTL